MKTIELENGKYVSMAAAEVTAVPYYESIGADLDKANIRNQILFTRLLQTIHGKGGDESISYELLFNSIPVNNQTYKAQVVLYIIVRRIGNDREENEIKTRNALSVFRNDLAENNYSVFVFEKPEDYIELEEGLASVDCERVISVSKKEKIVSSLLYPNGMIYYNDVVDASENINPSGLTNTLTLYPNSAVSIQIIPTQYRNEERLMIENSKIIVNTLVGEMRMRQGFMIDSSTQRVVDAFDYYSNSIHEKIYQFNCVVYAKSNAAVDLANKLIATVEVEGKPNDYSMEGVDISRFGLRPDKMMYATPWIINNILIERAREATFWGRSESPIAMKRMKQLMTVAELRGIFKFPIDDGRLIGIESNKISKNRERLHKSVISNDSFKVGVIYNTSRSARGDDAVAGVELNDFTKHGLIVGMPGSGKTNFSLGLLYRMWNEFGIPFIAIEPTKSEYRSLIDAIPELQVFTPGKNRVSPYIVNPFIPPTGVTVESYIPSLTAAFKAAFSMPDPLPSILLSTINDCYNEYGWKNDSTKDDPEVQWFGLCEFIRTFKNKVQHLDYKGDVKSNIESAGVVRLISLIEQNSNIYDTVNTIPLEDLLSKPTVIELNAINDKEQKSLIMAFLLIMICSHTKNNVAGDGRLKNIFLIDEAHVLLSNNAPVNPDGSKGAQGSTVEALEDMIAEIRSYGTGIIVADQSPARIGRNIIANTNVKVVFKLVEKENKDEISTSIGMEEADYDLLGRMGVGEALLHYGRLYRPLHIRTYDVNDIATMRKVVSDSEVAKLTTYWDTHKELLIPYNECSLNPECQKCCDLALRANADFIAKRLINTYLYRLSDKKMLVQFLVGMDVQINKMIDENSFIEPSLRLSNCIKIKFFRKALLDRNYGFTNAEYNRVLNHPNFLKSTAPVNGEN